MKKLLILSGKGGTGKTTVAGAFIKLSKARAFADCDVDAPNLHLVMEQKSKPKESDYFGMGQAEINLDICNDCGLCKENCRFGAIELMDSHYKVDGFSCEGCGVCEQFCPSKAIKVYPHVAGELQLYKENALFSTAQLKMGSGSSGKLVTEVKRQLNSAEENVELAIIDGSPGIGCPVIASISGVDMVLIVAEPSLSGISDLDRIISTAKKFDVETIICINKYDTNLQNTIKIEELCKNEKLEYAGRIPFDSNVVITINQGKSIIDVDCPATTAIKTVYQKTIGTLNRGRELLC